MSRINLRDIEDIDIDGISSDVDLCSDDRGEAPCPLVRQWILRTLVRMDETELQQAGARAPMAGLIAAVGLLPAKAGRRGNGRGWRKVDLHTELIEELKLSEQARPRPSPDLSRNVACVAALAGLSDVDGRVLAFAVPLHTDHSCTKRSIWWVTA